MKWGRDMLNRRERSFRWILLFYWSFPYYIYTITNTFNAIVRIFLRALQAWVPINLNVTTTTQCSARRLVTCRSVAYYVWQWYLPSTNPSLIFKILPIKSAPSDLLHAGAAEPCQLPRPRGQQRSAGTAIHSLSNIVDHGTYPCGFQVYTISHLIIHFVLYPVKYIGKDDYNSA